MGADAILHQGLQRVRALNRTGMNSMLSELDERYLQVRGRQLMIESVLNDVWRAGHLIHVCTVLSSE